MKCGVFVADRCPCYRIGVLSRTKLTKIFACLRTVFDKQFELDPSERFALLLTIGVVGRPPASQCKIKEYYPVTAVDGV
jgi:hypothetical protein